MRLEKNNLLLIIGGNQQQAPGATLTPLFYCQ